MYVTRRLAVLVAVGAALIVGVFIWNQTRTAETTVGEPATSSFQTLPTTTTRPPEMFPEPDEPIELTAQERDTYCSVLKQEWRTINVVLSEERAPGMADAARRVAAVAPDGHRAQWEATAAFYDSAADGISEEDRPAVNAGTEAALSLFGRQALAHQECPLEYLEDQ